MQKPERMRRMMKKLVALLLVAVMLFTCAAALADDSDWTKFDTVLFKIFDFSAEKWMATADNRGYLATFALLDYGIQKNLDYELTDMLTGTVFVGRKGTQLAVGFNKPNDSKSLFVVLDTKDPTQASYVVYDFNKSTLEDCMKQVCTDGYNLVSPDSINNAMNVIKEALNKSNDK